MEKKNLIIGGSIAAVVLIGAAVGIGIAASGNGGSDYHTSPVETFSYLADTSTTDKAFTFVGLSDGAPEVIDETTGETITPSSSEQKVMELLETNSDFHEIIENKEMTDGVISNHGLGFGNSGIIGYTFSDGSAQELTIYDDASTESDTSSLAAVLDISVKVPVEIADVLRGHLISAGPATELTFDEMDAALDGYGTWLDTNDYEKSFAIGFGYFNYATYSSTAKDALDTAGFNTAGVVGDQDDAAMTDWFDTTFGGWGLSFDTVETLYVDGSSTPDPAMSVIIDSFNDAGLGFSITEDLANNGSGAAWSLPTEAIPGLEAGGSEAVGREMAFLGAQSRNSKDTDATAFGYTTGTVTTDVDGVAIADNTSFANAGAILQTTMAIDSVSFFTSAKTTVLNPITGEEETPVGITKDGVVEAYEGGTSWNQLAEEGQIIFAS